MNRLASALAILAITPALIAADSDWKVPERLGSLVRVPDQGPNLRASYVELPAMPDGPVASLFVRRLGRTPAEDMAAADAPLYALAGVIRPGEMLATSDRCPEVIGRIDRGRLNGADTMTGSLYARRGEDNIKLRVTASLDRGVEFVATILRDFRARALGC